MYDTSGLDSAEFLALTTEYDALRRHTVAKRLGPTALAQAVEQSEIRDNTISNLSLAEFWAYLASMMDEGSTRPETALGQLEAAASEFDDAALHKMNLTPALNTDKPVSLSINPGKIGVFWIDLSKPTPEEMTNYLVAEIDEEGELIIKRRAKHEDLPARSGDNLLVRWILNEIANATSELRDK